MPELTSKERLQPSLLDRLMDDEPDKTHDGRDKRALSDADLRGSVKRDLMWLFNSTNLSCVHPDLEHYPEASQSVINYGMPDLAGRSVAGIDAESLERMFKEVIWRFEPRLDRSSVKVRLVVDDKQMSQNAMLFSIEAQLWAHPVPLQLHLRTEVDLDSGDVQVSEAGRGGVG